MQSKLNPYISFKNNAREAMEFYKSIFGGKLEITTFKEGGIYGDPGEDDKIMHSVLEADNGITFMASDTPTTIQYNPGTNISISLSGENETELTGYFNKLADGGQITAPLVKAPWGDTFGMLIDRFGIPWMVNIAGPKAAQPNERII